MSFTGRLMVACPGAAMFRWKFNELLAAHGGRQRWMQQIPAHGPLTVVLAAAVQATMEFAAQRAARSVRQVGRPAAATRHRRGNQHGNGCKSWDAVIGA